MRNPPKRHQPFHVQSTPNNTNHPRVIHPNEINRPTRYLLKRNRRGGACVPARTSAQRRFHTKYTRMVRGILTMDAPL